MSKATLRQPSIPLDSYQNQRIRKLFHIKITASVKKSSHQDLGLCCLHLPMFFLDIHSTLLLENKKLM